MVIEWNCNFAYANVILNSQSEEVFLEEFFVCAIVTVCPRQMIQRRVYTEKHSFEQTFWKSISGDFSFA